MDKDLIKKYGDLKVTDNVVTFLSRLPAKLQDNFLAGIKHYQQEIKDGMKKATPAEVMETVNPILDEFFAHDKHKDNVEISCKKGCAFCCHIQVHITEQEAIAIWQYCIENAVQVDTDYLQKQLPLEKSTHPRSHQSACVFLQSDNSCGIYPVRPVNCRKYYVVSDPKLCDARSIKQPVIVFTVPEMEMLAAGLYNAAREQDSIARMMLKYKPEGYESANSRRQSEGGDRPDS